MPVIGSSLITPPQFVEGPKGNTGLAGITGLAGASGVAGASGSTGATGTFVVSGYPSPFTRDLILVLSDGREIAIENIAGPTGASGEACGLSAGGGIGTTYSFLKAVTDGITFWFKGLSAEGTLDVYETSDTVGISGDIQYQRGATAPSVQGGRYAYLERMIGGANAFAGFTYAGATGSELTSTETGSIPFGKAATGNLYSYDPEEIIIPIGPLYRDGTYGLTGSDYSENPWGDALAYGVGIQLPVTRGSVYDVETPVGIRGFTGEFSSDEVFSFTMHLKGNDIWDWPENVYFDKNDLYFSCGYDIINFLTSDGGVSWKANVAVRGYGTSECQSVHGLGSCCYTDDENELNCRDYMTESECQELDSPFPDGEHGYWGPFSTCAENCGFTAQGVCCSEGGEWGNFGGTTRICLENIGATECDYFGGTFWTHYYYTKDEWGRTVPLDNPTVITCGEPTGACCIGPLCLSVVDTLAECTDAGGTYQGDGTDCADVDCSSGLLNTGACCIQTSCADNLTSDLCDGAGGTYQGDGSDCNTIFCGTGDPLGSCCIPPTPTTGACCHSDGTCSNQTFAECDGAGGRYRGDDTDCDNESCIGACCTYIDGTSQCNDISFADCDSAGGKYKGEGTICTGDEEECDFGACCVGGNTCYDVFESDCVEHMYGEYQGDYTECASVVCADGGGPDGTGDGGGEPPVEECDGHDGEQMFCCGVGHDMTGGGCDCDIFGGILFCCKDVWCPFTEEDCILLDGTPAPIFPTMEDCKESCCLGQAGHADFRSTGGHECVQNISMNDCVGAGGVWNPSGECVGECDDGGGDHCTNGGDELCIDPCCDPIACCKDGSCIGDTYGNYDEEHPETKLPPLTKVSCESVYGGISVPGVCGEVDCCNTTIYVGACCIDQVCDVMTAQTCKDINGVFMGPNSVCDNVDCCEPGGACCIIHLNGSSECLDVVNEVLCDSWGGGWQGRGTECATVTCTGRGACCFPAADCEDGVLASNCACSGCTYWGDGSTCCPPAE